MKRTSIVRIAAGTVAIIVILIVAAWGLGAFGGMSATGVFALALGIVISIGLGVALMVLVFYSSRERDEEVYISTTRDHAGSKPGADKPDRG